MHDDMEETIVQQHQQRKNMYELKNDLISLYIDNLRKMADETDEKKIYGELLFSIRIGKNMLPSNEKYSDLKKRANAILSSASTYPGNRSISLVDGDYVLSASGGAGSLRLTGDNSELFKGGNDDIITQQKTTLIPLLEPIDGEIRDALIESKILKIKEPSVDELIDDIIKEFIVTKR